jgi:hypothetical protein
MDGESTNAISNLLEKTGSVICSSSENINNVKLLTLSNSFFIISKNTGWYSRETTLQPHSKNAHVDIPGPNSSTVLT